MLATDVIDVAARFSTRSLVLFLVILQVLGRKRRFTLDTALGEGSI